MDSIHLMTLFMEVFHETSMSEAYRYALRTAWEPGDPGPELDVTSSNSFRQWIKAGLDAHQLLKKQPHVSCITTRVTRLAANLKPFPQIRFWFNFSVFPGAENSPWPRLYWVEWVWDELLALSSAKTRDSATKSQSFFIISFRIHEEKVPCLLGLLHPPFLMRRSHAHCIASYCIAVASCKMYDRQIAVVWWFKFQNLMTNDLNYMFDYAMLRMNQSAEAVPAICTEHLTLSCSLRFGCFFYLVCLFLFCLLPHLSNSITRLFRHLFENKSASDFAGI